MSVAGPRVSAVLVLTYRDDEVGRDHPLQGVLGVLGGAAVHRLPLHRLTADAVTALAAPTLVDPTVLHRLTGGNPFFVTEALATPEAAVPAHRGGCGARQGASARPGRAGIP